MTHEWSELETLPDFTTISLTTVVMLFAALLIPLRGYAGLSAGLAFDLFGTTWLFSLAAYAILRKWEAVEHAYADNVISVVAGFVIGSAVAFKAFTGTVTALWTDGFVMLVVASLLVAVMFGAFFQILTRRLGGD